MFCFSPPQGSPPPPPPTPSPLRPPYSEVTFEVTLGETCMRIFGERQKLQCSFFPGKQKLHCSFCGNYAFHVAKSQFQKNCRCNICKKLRCSFFPPNKTALQFFPAEKAAGAKLRWFQHMRLHFSTQSFTRTSTNTSTHTVSSWVCACQETHTNGLGVV